MNFWTDPTNLILAAFAAGSGALLAWPKLIGGSGATGIGTLKVTQLINSKNALVLDVREADEFAKGSITGARNIPSGAVADRIGEFARFKAKPVIVVCQTGQRSGKVAAQLLKGGFAEVYNLSGGISAWQQAGLPIVVGGKAAGTKVPAKTSGQSQSNKREALRQEQRHETKQQAKREAEQESKQEAAS